MQLEYWAEDKAVKMENQSIKNDYLETKSEIDKYNGPRFYKKHLLNSINESLGRKDLESISSLY